MLGFMEIGTKDSESARIRARGELVFLKIKRSTGKREEKSRKKALENLLKEKFKNKGVYQKEEVEI